MHGNATSQGGRRRPQGIIRGWDQHLVAVVQQRLGGHGDQLGNPVAQKDIVNIERWEILQLIAGDDRPPRRNNALGSGITLGGRQCRNHIPHDHIRGIKTKGRRVAGVELQDAVAVRLHALGQIRDGATDRVGHILDLVGLIKNARRVTWMTHSSILPKTLTLFPFVQLFTRCFLRHIESIAAQFCSLRSALRPLLAGQLFFLGAAISLGRA